METDEHDSSSPQDNRFDRTKLIKLEILHRKQLTHNGQ